MPDAEIFRFKIDAYTPDTMPMGRLAEYMAEIATILGERGSVHFVELECGSTTLVHKIDGEAVPKVRERLERVRRGEGAPEAMTAMRVVNRKLKEDNTAGRLQDRTAEILEFLGKNAAQPLTFDAFNQDGTLDGIVIKLGGRKELVPVHIDAGPIVYSSCVAQRPVAKRLAEHIFTNELRVKGNGRWLRDEFGAWVLERFTIFDFDVLDSEPLTSVVAELRGIPGSDWDKHKDLWTDLKAIRDGSNEPH